MQIILNKTPKNPIVIQGFPSFGLVSAIAIKFLVDNLDLEEIGYIESENIVPLTAIHKGKVINPITLFYNKKHNLVVIQSLTEVKGLEWELAATLNELVKTISAKELIILESMPSHQGNLDVYYLSNKSKLKLKELKEGIVMGTTAAMLVKTKNIPVTCIFAEAHSQFPDSESAAKVIEALNHYLKLNLDYKPLLETAKKFEASLKHYTEKVKEAPQMSSKEKKDLNYFG